MDRLITVRAIVTFRRVSSESVAMMLIVEREGLTLTAARGFTHGGASVSTSNFAQGRFQEICALVFSP